MKEVEKYQLTINNLISNKIKSYINKLEVSYSKLNALNPYLLLNKGYSLLVKDNEIITTTDQLEIDDTIEINLKDGKVISKVIEIKKG